MKMNFIIVAFVCMQSVSTHMSGATHMCQLVQQGSALASSQNLPCESALFNHMSLGGWQCQHVSLHCKQD